MSDLQQQLQAALGNAYTLERELGGGMSRVFTAREQSLNRFVVIKVLADPIARHDPWLIQNSHELRFDRLRKDPCGKVLMLKLDG